MKQRISTILASMATATYERDEVLALSLLSALAGESIFLLGLPGVGKSMIARRLKYAFSNASVFEYLMSRFSTPDEIFGPVSISRLKDHDIYERITSGYLPEADIVFLDEIWKAGPAIQNSLLTVLNERIYLNGNNEIHLPLKGVIAASNELPAKNEGLEALWDRFLMRYIVEPIGKNENFIRLLTPSATEAPTDSPTPLTDRDCQVIKEQIRQIDLPAKPLEVICAMREKLNALVNQKDAVSGRPNEENARYYISDRRWKKAVGVLRTSAFLNDRRAVDLSDLLLLAHMLWNDETARSTIQTMICEQIVHSLFTDIVRAQENPKRHVRKTTRKPTSDPLYSPDGKHYLVMCEGTPMQIRKEDYSKIMTHPQEIFFASEDINGVLRLLDMGQYTVRTSKPGHLCINSFDYPLKTTAESEMNQGAIGDMAARMELATMDLEKQIRANIFVAKSSVVSTLDRVLRSFLKRLEEE